MKTWITYLAALFLGFATTLLFADSVVVYSVLFTLTGIALKIGTLLFLPMILVALASGVASLRKDQLGRKVLSSGIAWSVVTAVVLPVAAALLIRAANIGFPVSSTAGSSGSFSAILPTALTEAAGELLTGNIFYTIVRSTEFLLPVIIFSWILGYALKPNADVIKPAYITMNSFSEVLFRISRTYTVFGYILVYCSSAFFFTQLYQEKTIFASPRFLIAYVLICCALSLVVLPLLFLVFTKFKRNPWQVLFRSITPTIAALTTGSYIFSAPMMVSSARHNIGVQKRVAATAVPLFNVIGRAGSAAIAAMSAITLTAAVTGSMIGMKEAIILALCCSLASFASSVAGGVEVIFIIAAAFSLTNINLYGAEMTVVGLLPLITGLGCLIDIQVGMLGSLICGRRIETDIVPPYKDLI